MVTAALLLTGAECLAKQLRGAQPAAMLIPHANALRFKRQTECAGSEATASLPSLKTAISTVSTSSRLQLTRQEPKIQGETQSKAPAVRM